MRPLPSTKGEVMGLADQVGKQVFAQELSRVTGEACQWEPPGELPVGTELQPDGAIRVVNPANLARLPAPWRVLRGRSALLELKMPGDHVDERAWVRALARRGLWDLVEFELGWRNERRDAAQRQRPPAHVPLAPHADLLFVSPHLPGWIQSLSDKEMPKDTRWIRGSRPQSDEGADPEVRD